MTKAEKEKIKEMLDDAVRCYLLFRDRDDYPDKPCVRKETNTRQMGAYHLADSLFHSGFITFEEWCEYLSKVDITDPENENCNYRTCGGNENGKCKYVVEANMGEQNEND